MTASAMSKTVIPVELQVILRDLSITETDSGRALQKVHRRAALQVSDYIHIMLIKFQVGSAGNASLLRTICETRAALNGVQHADDAGEQQHEADVVM
jgi:hypothetical protein